MFLSLIGPLDVARDGRLLFSRWLSIGSMN